MLLRVSAISFLNPAPLLYNFEHEPTATELRSRYLIHYTSPAQCAAELHSGAADLGLIPVAELTPDLRVVPGCSISSREEVRSILLLVRNPENLSTAEALRRVRRVAADTASRSSVAYVHVILRHFYGDAPELIPHVADPLAMLAEHDAALLIGDPALLARERRAEIDQAAGAPLLWLDVARLWKEHTGMPWIAAVWAVRPEALASASERHQLITDLAASRNNGLLHIEQLVQEWLPRLPLRRGDDPPLSDSQHPLLARPRQPRSHPPLPQAGRRARGVTASADARDAFGGLSSHHRLRRPANPPL